MTSCLGDGEPDRSNILMTIPSCKGYWMVSIYTLTALHSHMLPGITLV